MGEVLSDEAPERSLGYEPTSDYRASPLDTVPSATSSKVGFQSIGAIPTSSAGSGPVNLHKAVSGYSMNRPLLSDAGRSEAIKLVTMRARTGAACALPNLGHIDVFQQLEAARRKI